MYLQLLVKMILSFLFIPHNTKFLGRNIPFKDVFKLVLFIYFLKKKMIVLSDQNDKHCTDNLKEK